MYNLYIIVNTIRKSVSQLVPVAALATIVGDGSSTPTLKKNWIFFSIRYQICIFIIDIITIAHRIFEQ